MPTRRSRRAARSASETADSLPTRFYHPDPIVNGGQLVGLAAYMDDLDNHLTEQHGPRRTGAPSAVDIMEALGAAPDVWYRHALTKQAEKGSGG
ncbi:MAG: hypothetical protein ACRC20_07145 [Segniliparus sp.]|uniref:hypothetical protein n=1 Tax=Segniliparus sp. TaxID=2804064 RepID=UPI003F4021AE